MLLLVKPNVRIEAAARRYGMLLEDFELRFPAAKGVQYEELSRDQHAFEGAAIGFGGLPILSLLREVREMC